MNEAVKSRRNVKRFTRRFTGSPLRRSLFRNRFRVSRTIQPGASTAMTGAFPSASARQPGQASTAHSPWRRKIRVADRVSDVYRVSSLLDIDASGVGP
jgi:hypothetical protein